MIKKCKCCGEEFEATDYRCRLCAECKTAHLKENQETQRLQRKGYHRSYYDRKKKEKESPYSVEKTHREILEYEKQTGKRLTYGQYQTLKLTGQI